MPTRRSWRIAGAQLPFQPMISRLFAAAYAGHRAALIDFQRFGANAAAGALKGSARLYSRAACFSIRGAVRFI